MNFISRATVLLFLLVPSAGAQTREDLDFLKDLPDFQNLSNMLPAYLKAQAGASLAARRKAVDGLQSVQDVAQRRAYVREKMIQAVGGFPERTPLNARAVGVLERDDYKIEKVIFESQPGFYVTGNLYLPKKGSPPYPGILYPLGHERGAKANPTWQQMLVTLARRGYVAFTWDTLGQGERLQLYDPDLQGSKASGSTTEHTILGIQCLLTGDNIARYTIWDGMRALDYLLSRKEVDASRIACTGNSGGGTHTAYLSALDDRIHVAAPSCYLTTWRHLLDTIGPQDAEQCLPPWLADGLDHADFIHAFAPKPYLVLAAIRDFFSIQGARETFREAREIYRRLGVVEKVRLFEADDGHGYNRERRFEAYRWFGRWLKGQEDDEAEIPIEPETEEALYCTPSGQVASSLGGETVFSLNQKRFEQNGKKAPSLASTADVKSYQAVVRSQALRLSGFEPVKGSVPVSGYGVLDQFPDFRIEKLTYESQPGIVVPGLLFVPRRSDGRRPAILYVHGRGKAADGLAGGDIQGWVKAGFVVLAIDYRGSGETRAAQNPEQANEMYRFFGDYDSAMTALLLRKTLVGMRAADIVRGIDLLEGRPEVDKEKVYAVGKEIGAVPLLYAALADTRLRRIVLEGMLLSYESVVRRRMPRQVFENVVPQALKFFDLPDLVAALAPREIWVVNPVDALGHRVASGETSQTLAPALNAYKLSGAAGALRLKQRKPEEPILAVYQELLEQR